MNEKAFMSWSGGKDSALALYKAQQAEINVQALVTSVNTAFDRVSMHGVRRQLLEAQAASLGLPLYTIELPEQPSMQEYETALHKSHRQLKEEGFTSAIFGDIFLEDLKTYREETLAKDGLNCLFPIWKMRSSDVVKEFLAEGFKAVVVCVNNHLLDKSFCGRLMDESFFANLPSTVDACGENGEYHSFVFDGPNFSFPINYCVGETVIKEYAAPKNGDECFTKAQPSIALSFCDLLPA